MTFYIGDYTITVFDNRGKTADRYSVRVQEERLGEERWYGMSDNVLLSIGVNMCIDKPSDEYLQESCKALDVIPVQLITAISNRLNLSSYAKEGGYGRK